MLLYGLRSYGKVSKKKSPDMDLDMSYLHIAIIKGQGCTLSLEKCLSEKDYSRLGDKSRRSPSILCPECAVEAQSNCS